jgi:biopolymer transport protein ExbD
MARTSVFGRGPVTPEFNMTPMIDVTFQLTLFFLLAGTFASLDSSRLSVPSVYDERMLADLKLRNKAVVNIPPYSEKEIQANPSLKGMAESWKVSTVTIQRNPDRLVRELQQARAQFEDRKAKEPALAGMEFQVEVRADRSIQYSQVAPVLVAISKAGFPRVHYVATASAQVK